MTMLDIHDGLYESPVTWGGMVRHDIQALIASTFPVNPPRNWFEDPGLTQVTPLTVESSGRVYGHAATWKQSHIGMIGKVQAPRSRTDYSFFRTGVLHCDDDSTVNVGQITLSGGHAPLEAGVGEAVAHYDDTRSAMMDIACGEDDHGIWVAGAMRPDVDELKLRAIRAASISGDWRPINGNLELVAICAVNVPGFPIARARVASGQVIALVACGTEDLVITSLFDQLGVDMESVVAAISEPFDERLKLVEDALLDRVRDRRGEIADSSLEIFVSETDELVASLRDRVRPPEPTLWDDEMEVDLSTDECVQASLRARIHGGVTATATAAWKADKRKDAAKKGAALPDGSYPIADKKDWYKARQALGRAKNRAKVVRHLKKRGRALGIPKEQVDRLTVAVKSSAAPEWDIEEARRRVHAPS